MALIDKLVAIGDAVRNQTRTTEPMTLDEMAVAITNIEGEKPIIDAITINENGVYQAPNGIHGYSPITVDIPAYVPVVEEITITENGTYQPDEGIDGFNKVIVETMGSGDIPSGEEVEF